MQRLITTAIRWGQQIHQEERGDIPGWVMLAVLSALLVIALLAVATPLLSGLFEDAIETVRPGG